jgi:hypothetical protein
MYYNNIMEMGKTVNIKNFLIHQEKKLPVEQMGAKAEAACNKLRGTLNVKMNAADSIIDFFIPSNKVDDIPEQRHGIQYLHGKITGLSDTVVHKVKGVSQETVESDMARDGISAVYRNVPDADATHRLEAKLVSSPATKLIYTNSGVPHQSGDQRLLLKTEGKKPGETTIINAEITHNGDVNFQIQTGVQVSETIGNVYNNGVLFVKYSPARGTIYFHKKTGGAFGSSSLSECDLKKQDDSWIIEKGQSDFNIATIVDAFSAVYEKLPKMQLPQV